MSKGSSRTLLLAACLMLCVPLPRAAATAEAAPRAGAQTPRPAAAVRPKFALLVGINRYLKVNPLSGCENDVDDMKAALTGQFQFPSDKEHVLTLKSEQAKKQSIIAAFRSHLIANAKKYKDQKPTIVFYFSGHGSRARDANQDEGDGWDETLVPHDRGVNNVTDILDDEIDALFEELRRYTTNITFIMDSCHSATTTRAADLVPRKAPPLNPADARAEDAPVVSGPKDRGNAVLERRVDSYVALSGCLPDQLSYENTRTTEDGQPRTNGIMTFHLLQALRLRPDATYRELGDMVRRAVEDKYSFQSPQIEGNLDRPIFEGADPNARNYVAVSAADKQAQTVTIAAGQAQDIKKGTFVAIYAKGAKKLSGPHDRLADAEVIDVKAFESVARLQQDAKPVAPGDKAIILTPGFGSERLPVALDTSMKVGGPGAGVIKEVQRLLENHPAAGAAQDRRNPLVEVVLTAERPLDKPAGAPWSVAVVRDTFARYKQDLTRPFVAGRETAAPANGDEVYYVTTREGNPLYDFFVRADAPDAAPRIVDALEKRARQKNVAAISNGGSPLRGQIKLRLLKVDVDDSGRETPRGDLPATAEGVQSLKLGERFRFQIENNSAQKVFLTLIAINPSGSISLLSTPEDFGGEVSPNIPVKSGRLRTGSPLGKTVFKLMVTTKKVDFSFLGQPGIPRDTKAKAGLTHPFERLFGQAYFGGTREVGKDDIKGFDDWTTVDIDLIVSEK